MKENLSVKKSSIHGMGVFTNNPIKKGQKISYLKGKIHFLKIKSNKDSLSHQCWVGIGKDLWIDPEFGHGRYLNHSCDPTASIVGKVTVIALKNLKPGEEITIDYSLVEGDPRWYMRCGCGSRNCRKIIRSVNFLPDKLFKKYKLFMPKYFKNLYIKNHKSV